MSTGALTSWLLHVALGGGLLLLLARLLLVRTRQPARRQRLGEWAVAAALLLALLSVAPAWLIIRWPAAHESPAATPSVAAQPPEEKPAAAVAPVPLPPPAVMAPAVLAPAVIPAPIAPRPEVAANAGPEPRTEKARFPVPAAPSVPMRVWLLRGVLILYVAGALALLLHWLLGHFALYRLLRDREPVPRALARLFAEMTLGQRGVRLRVARRVRVPFSHGVLRPTVVLPADLAEEAPPEVLRWVLAHELSHLERRDAWANLLFGLAQVIYFFVPWFWWLRRQVRLSQEFLADAAAVAAGGNPADYAQLLIGWAAGPVLPATATGMSGQPSELYRRVTMLLQGPTVSEPRCPRRWSLLAACGLLALAVLVAGLGLNSQAAPVQGKAVEQPKKEEVRKEKEKKAEPAEKEDPQLEEWMKRLPPGTPPEIQRLMRRNMETILKQQKAILGGMNLPAFGGAMMPGFAPLERPDSTESRLGARLAAPSTALIDQLDLPRGQGLVLENVPPASAAAKAGLKDSDILLELDGKPVPSKVEELPRLFEGIKANKPIEAVVMRKGKMETIKGLSLPEAKKIEPAPAFPNFPNFPNIEMPGFGPGFPNLPNIQIPNLRPNFPNLPNINLPRPGNLRPRLNPPAGGFRFPNINLPGGGLTMTTTSRSGDRFTTRHQENSLIITVTGTIADGKSVVSEIRVQDGNEVNSFRKVADVPERYRGLVKSLIR